jgi:hypothetical protein
MVLLRVLEAVLTYSVPSKNDSDSATQLAFPWHKLGIDKTLNSGRAQAYLRWLMRQPQQRKLRYLDKVLGLTQHKYRSQYPKHLQRKARNDSNLSYNKEPKQWL